MCNDKMLKTDVLLKLSDYIQIILSHSYRDMRCLTHDNFVFSLQMSWYVNPSQTVLLFRVGYFMERGWGMMDTDCFTQRNMLNINAW